MAEVAPLSAWRGASGECAGGGGGGAEGDVFGSRFQVLHKIGQGTFGAVYKALDRDTGEPFALKEIRVVYEEEGIPGMAIREVSLLKECNHPNVVKLYEVIEAASALYLVFEYLDMDLCVLLKRRGPLRDAAWLQSAMRQCHSGVDFCHSHRIIHRDLKPQNVLVDERRRLLKLADFGLARYYAVPLRAYTHEVVTLWYRAPEILLGVAKYATQTDVWSLGCMSAEMATGCALFPGQSEIDTLFQIFRRLGTPTEEVWPGVESLRDFSREFPQWDDTRLEDLRAAAPALGDPGIQLLRACLTYSPVERVSARRALQHPFFRSWI